MPLPDFLVLDRDQYGLAPGKSRLVMYGPVPVLLLRTRAPESQLRVFVATYTHLNCTVGYREDIDQIFCACHEGYFDTSGRVLAGPPPRPLQTMFSKVKDGKLIIALDEAKLASAPG